MSESDEAFEEGVEMGRRGSRQTIADLEARLAAAENLCNVLASEKENFKIVLSGRTEKLIRTEHELSKKDDDWWKKHGSLVETLNTAQARIARLEIALDGIRDELKARMEEPCADTEEERNSEALAFALMIRVADKALARREGEKDE